MTTNERIKEIAERHANDQMMRLAVTIGDAKVMAELIEEAILEATKDLSATIEAQKKEVGGLNQKCEDQNKMLNFQEMHKSAILLEDQKRMDKCLKNSYIIINGVYLTSREAIDSTISKQRNEL